MMKRDVRVSTPDAGYRITNDYGHNICVYVCVVAEYVGGLWSNEGSGESS